MADPMEGCWKVTYVKGVTSVQVNDVLVIESKPGTEEATVKKGTSCATAVDWTTGTYSLDRTVLTIDGTKETVYTEGGSKRLTCSEYFPFPQPTGVWGAEEHGGILIPT